MELFAAWCVCNYSLMSMYDNGYKRKNYWTKTAWKLAPWHAVLHHFGAILQVMLQCWICKPILHKIWLVFSGKSPKNHKNRSYIVHCHLIVLFPLWRVFLSFYPSLHKCTVKLEMRWENMLYFACLGLCQCCSLTPMLQTWLWDIALGMKLETGWKLWTHRCHG